MATAWTWTNAWLWTELTDRTDNSIRAYGPGPVIKIIHWSDTFVQYCFPFIPLHSGTVFPNLTIPTHSPLGMSPNSTQGTQADIGVPFIMMMMLLIDIILLCNSDASWINYLKQKRIPHDQFVGDSCSSKTVGRKADTFGSMLFERLIVWSRNARLVFVLSLQFDLH